MKLSDTNNITTTETLATLLDNFVRDLILAKFLLLVCKNYEIDSIKTKLEK